MSTSLEDLLWSLCAISLNDICHGFGGGVSELWASYTYCMCAAPSGLIHHKIEALWFRNTVKLGLCFCSHAAQAATVIEQWMREDGLEFRSVWNIMDLFVFCLCTALSVSRNIQSRMVGWLVNNELDRSWKEASEQDGSSGNASVLTFGRCDVRISGWTPTILIYSVILLSLSRQIPGYDLKLGHDRFLPHPFRFIVYYDPIIRRYMVWVTDRVIK
jgi:hypothetical protein